MKIAITSSGTTFDAHVDPQFGRCPYFMLVDTETMDGKAIENPNVALGGGAGIQAAQLMSDRGVETVLTGNCGPNAHETLSAVGIEVIVGCAGALRDVVEQFRAGELGPATEPNVASQPGTTGPPGTLTKNERLARLKEQASSFAQRLEQVQGEIERLEQEE